MSALPEESATVRTVVPAAVWSLEAHLLASVIELLDANRKQMVALLADPKKVNKRDLKPLVIDRPGMPSKYERKGTPLGFLTVQGEDSNGDR